MGLFVLKASNSVIDRLKATLANLKLDERLSGNNKNYLVSDFAIPYLESVIKDLEGDAPENAPSSGMSPILDESLLPLSLQNTLHILNNAETLDSETLKLISEGHMTIHPKKD